MFRITLSVCLFGCLLSVGTGCANFIETRTIDRFVKAMQENDLEGLKAQSTEEFEHKSLRLDGSLDILDRLNLPEGDVSVEEVEDVSPDEKKVVVQVEVGKRKKKRKRKVLYELRRDPKTKKWLVDDIYIKQKQKGLTAAKSVTEQMDLLSSVREFLNAWNEGSREEMLATTMPELRGLLEDLPPVFLARLARKVVGDQSEKTKIRPEAQLDEDTALVTIPRSVGKLVMTFELADGSWKAADLAVESRADDKHIASLARTASAMRSAITFLRAYNLNDRPMLSALCTRRLFDECLSHADLSSIQLPRADDSHSDYEVSISSVGANFVLHGKTEYIRVSMVRQDDATGDGPTEFIVDDVSIYELHSNQNKSLSSMFNSRAVVRIFVDAVARRDLKILENTSSPNFNQKVWDRLDPTTIAGMPLDIIEQPIIQEANSIFNGAVTEITVKQGSHNVTYVLNDRSGRVRVDDVLVTLPDRPRSTKKVMSMLIPVTQFALAVSRFDLGATQRVSSKDFTRTVWRHVDDIPAICQNVPSHLVAPLKSITQGDDKVLVTLGDGNFGARVLLVRVLDQLVVDEIQLIAGVDDSRRMKLKESLSAQLTNSRFSRRAEVKPPTNQSPVPRQTTNSAPLHAPILQTGVQPAAEAAPVLEPSETAFDPPSNSSVSNTPKAVALPVQP